MLRLKRLRSERGEQFVAISSAELLWALGSVCALHRKTFDANLLAREFPYTPDEPASQSTLIRAAQRLGFKVRTANVSAKSLHKLIAIGIAMATSSNMRTTCRACISIWWAC